jgi:hypothetical protein
LAHVAILSMNNGEVSPQIDARSDVEKYSSSCRTLENMLPLVYGGVTRRPGTEYIYGAKSNDTAVRLIPFIYSATIAYICEFGDEYVRFYYNGEILKSGGSIVEVASPYAAADLPQLQYRQVGDVMRITHPDYAQRTLSRITTSSFRLEEISFTEGPFLLRNDLLNDNGVTLASDVVAAEDEGTLTASNTTFSSGHLGAIFELTHPRTTTNIHVAFAASDTSDPISIKGSFYLRTHGTWNGLTLLERNDNSAGWETYRTFSSVNDTNISEAFTEEDDGISFRIQFVRTGGTLYADLTTYETTILGIAKITGVTSDLISDITLLTALDPDVGTDATPRWSEGAWSTYRGFPASVAFFEDRCVYAGSSYRPQVVWLSESGDYDTFDEGVNNDDSFNLTLTTTNDIQWVEPLEAILVGTSGNIWSISSTKLYAALTPTNFAAREQATDGVKNIQPIRYGKALLFVDYTGRKLRELSYDYSTDKYPSIDLTAFAEHITDSGIVALAFQKSPDPIVWSVRSDGMLLSLTYEREQNVISWARHPLRTGDTVESVAVIPGEDEDEVWLATVRSINGSTVRYIERMKPRDFDTQADAFFVDSGYTYEGVATTTITGLDHLEGETVQVLGDGAVFAETTVSSGEITLDSEVETAHVGLPYTYTVKPMRIDVSVQGGTSKSSFKKITEMYVSFYQTLGAKYGKDEDHLTTIPWRTDETYSSPPALFTGDKKVVLDAGYDRETEFIITGNDPLPCTVRAIVVKMEVSR